MQNHVHTFDTDTWENDETHHWHTPNCEYNSESCAGDKSLRSDYEEHVDSDSDLSCDVCLASLENISDDDAIIIPPSIIGQH